MHDARTPRSHRRVSFHMTFDPPCVVKTSGLIVRYWSNLPAGEVFTTPVGRRHPRPRRHRRRLLQRERRHPQDAVVSRSRATPVSAARGDPSATEHCHTDAQSDHVGELAFGTNLDY
jgi:leucyl aminopeptidase (aminopeptidase T)